MKITLVLLLAISAPAYADKPIQGVVECFDQRPFQAVKERALWSYSLDASTLQLTPKKSGGKAVKLDVDKKHATLATSSDGTRASFVRGKSGTALDTVRITFSRAYTLECSDASGPPVGVYACTIQQGKNTATRELLVWRGAERVGKLAGATPKDKSVDVKGKIGSDAIDIEVDGMHMKGKPTVDQQGMSTWKLTISPNGSATCMHGHPVRERPKTTQASRPEGGQDTAPAACRKNGEQCMTNADCCNENNPGNPGNICERGECRKCKAAGTPVEGSSDFDQCCGWDTQYSGDGNVCN